VVVSRWYPSDAEPLAGVFVEDQVRALQRACEVQVLVPVPAALSEVIRFVAARGALGTVEHVPAARTPLGLPLRLLVFARAFSRLGARAGDDVVVHVHLLLPDALPALAAARIRRWPVAVTEHVNFLGDLLRSRRARIQARLLLRHADAVLPVSRALENELRELEPRARLRRIANPVDLDRFAPAERPSRDFALNVAVALGEAKGTDVLLRGWARAREGTSLPPLVLVGDGPGRPAAERLAGTLGLAASCRFVGRLSRDEVAALLRDAAFLVSASRSENVAGIVSEAIASGTPVVSTRTGEPASYVTDDVGLLVEPGDVEGLAAAVREMARRHGDYDAARLHEHMRALYGVETVLQQLLELYRELLARRASRSWPA
jgi:glycosyltransferase involved in cell wall biosynthesis